MLNKRMLLIIEYLINNNGKGILKEMVDFIDMSERTIRYDIDKINEFLLDNKAGEVIKKPKGEIELFNPQRVKNYLLENFHKIFFLEYRDLSILISILFKGKINISHLCEKFDLSRTTIKNDLKGIKKVLSKYNLELIISPKKGLLLKGREEDVRRLQLKILNDHFKIGCSSSLEKTYTSIFIKENFKEIDIKHINSFIDDITKLIDKVISDEAYSIIRNYLLIMISRIKEEFYLNSSPNKKFMSTTEEIMAVSKITPILEENYQINLNEFEIFKLTDYFLGSHSYNTNMSFYENWIEIETMTKKIIRKFSKEICLDLSKDEFLINGLLNHIKPAIHRIKNNIELKNSIYSEVIVEYPRLFEVTKSSIIILEEFLEKPFPQEEVCFLVLHFKGAVDRNLYKKKETKKILLVCGGGLGTSKLIEQQLKENYDINVIKTIPLNQLEKTIVEKKEKPDLIITTLEINEFNTEIPVIHVKTILNIEELKKLEKYNLPKYNKKILISNILKSLRKGAVIEDEKIIIKELKKHLGNKLIDDTKGDPPILSELLLPSNIELNVKVKTWQEAIKKAGNILYREGYVEENYSDEMVKVISKFGPYMVIAPNLAIPHTEKKYVKRTGMSLITLTQPAYFFGGIPVNTVLAFSSVDDSEHFFALSKFLEMVKSYDFIKKAHSASSSKKIIEIIKKYEFFINLGKHKELNF